jgi:hypothetical protein
MSIIGLPVLSWTAECRRLDREVDAALEVVLRAFYRLHASGRYERGTREVALFKARSRYSEAKAAYAGATSYLTRLS